MPNLESEQSPEQKNQAGQGLKIQTPNQILSRLLIHLAQLQSGNNSQKTEKWDQTAATFFASLKKLTKTNNKHS